MDTYKRPVKKKQEVFAFFKFYYYIFKRSPKKFDMISGKGSAVSYVVFTPFVLFMLMMTLHLTYGVATQAAWTYLPFSVSAIVMIINTYMQQAVRSEAYALEAELAAERREAQREQRQREHEETMRRIQREFEERRDQIHQQWRERQQHEWYQRQQRNRQHYDNNQQRERATDGGTMKDKLLAAYSTLEIAPTRNSAIIRTAYRTAAKKHHPDAGGEQKKFIAVKQAYDLLMKAVGMTAGGVQ